MNKFLTRKIEEMFENEMIKSNNHMVEFQFYETRYETDIRFNLLHNKKNPFIETIIRGLKVYADRLKEKWRKNFWKIIHAWNKNRCFNCIYRNTKNGQCTNKLSRRVKTIVMNEFCRLFRKKHPNGEHLTPASQRYRDEYFRPFVAEQQIIRSENEISIGDPIIPEEEIVEEECD